MKTKELKNMSLKELKDLYDNMIKEKNNNLDAINKEILKRETEDALRKRKAIILADFVKSARRLDYESAKEIVDSLPEEMVDYILEKTGNGFVNLSSFRVSNTIGF